MRMKPAKEVRLGLLAVQNLPFRFCICFTNTATPQGFSQGRAGSLHDTALLPKSAKKRPF